MRVWSSTVWMPHDAMSRAYRHSVDHASVVCAATSWHRASMLRPRSSLNSSTGDRIRKGEPSALAGVFDQGGRRAAPGVEVSSRRRRTAHPSRVPSRSPSRQRRHVHRRRTRTRRGKRFARRRHQQDHRPARAVRRGVVGVGRHHRHDLRDDRSRRDGARPAPPPRHSRHPRCRRYRGPDADLTSNEAAPCAVLAVVDQAWSPLGEGDGAKATGPASGSRSARPER
jgi:hypothetical protein